MGSRAYNKYCQDQELEYLESEVAAEMEDLEMCKKKCPKNNNSGMSRVEKAIRNKTATFKIIPEGSQVRLLVCGHSVDTYDSYDMALHIARDVANHPEDYNFPE